MNDVGPSFAADQEEQGRQDSNLQPPVLETGALPIELHPSVASGIVSPRLRHDQIVGRYAMPALFSVLTAVFVVIALAAATHSQWIIAAASAALALWMGQFAWSSLRRSRR
jgi:hypothetical protein